ncbi:hypothetical protein HOLleu_04534 [Holothuria leucospilota]|uniref:Uncharacterized protein n=1 Tax=Holothuria leucospilota TaxID=206669 RepID=A0A9Q1CUK7_HOLLE|nr:hypothetical protein HOLleu_04534 [Holothuria leucospilota]
MSCLNIHIHTFIFFFLFSIVTTMQKTKAPKTIMKYLQSVRKLGSYMMVEEEEAMLLGIPQSKLAKTERLASAIINGLRPLAKKRESQLKAQIRDKLIDPSDVRKFCNLLKKEASPHINRLSNGEKIPWTDLLLVRNYIIIELLLAGAPRSGVITKFSLGHFEKAQKLVREDGSTYWIGNLCLLDVQNLSMNTRQPAAMGQQGWYSQLKSTVWPKPMLTMVGFKLPMQISWMS